MGDVVKLEKKGDSVEGKFASIEESRQFKDSYAIRVETKDGLKVIFASKIVRDLLEANNVEAGRRIKIVFNGKKMNEAKTREYNDYELYVA